MNILSTLKSRNRQQEKGYQDGFAAGVDIAIKVNLFAIILYLGDVRGWKRERIFDCLLWLHKHCEMILEDYMTFDEIIENVGDEYGIIQKNGTFYLLPEKEWKEAVAKKQKIEYDIWKENLRRKKEREAKEANKNGKQ